MNLLQTKNSLVATIVILFFLIMLLEARIALAQDGVSKQQWEQLTQVETSNTGSKPTETNVDNTEDEVPFKHAEISTKPITPEIIQVPSDGASTEVPMAPPERRPEENFVTGATLQALNKITARTTKLDIQLNNPIKFGNLNITLHACWHSPPEESNESKALLEIWEEIPGEIRKKIFSGWMFASSPLLSAPEHPVYDIIVLECRVAAAKSN